MGCQPSRIGRASVYPETHTQKHVAGSHGHTACIASSPSPPPPTAESQLKDTAKAQRKTIKLVGADIDKPIEVGVSRSQRQTSQLHTHTIITAFPSTSGAYCVNQVTGSIIELEPRLSRSQQLHVVGGMPDMGSDGSSLGEQAKKTYAHTTDPSQLNTDAADAGRVVGMKETGINREDTNNKMKSKSSLEEGEQDWRDDTNVTTHQEDGSIQEMQLNLPDTHPVQFIPPQSTSNDEAEGLSHMWCSSDPLFHNLHAQANEVWETPCPHSEEIFAADLTNQGEIEPTPEILMAELECIDAYPRTPLHADNPTMANEAEIVSLVLQGKHISTRVLCGSDAMPVQLPGNFGSQSTLSSRDSISSCGMNGDSNTRPPRQVTITSNHDGKEIRSYRGSVRMDPSSSCDFSPPHTSQSRPKPNIGSRRISTIAKVSESEDALSFKNMATTLSIVKLPIHQDDGFASHTNQSIQHLRLLELNSSDSLMILAENPDSDLPSHSRLESGTMSPAHAINGATGYSVIDQEGDATNPTIGPRSTFSAPQEPEPTAAIDQLESNGNSRIMSSQQREMPGRADTYPPERPAAYMPYSYTMPPKDRAEHARVATDEELRRMDEMRMDVLVGEETHIAISDALSLLNAIDQHHGHDIETPDQPLPNPQHRFSPLSHPLCDNEVTAFSATHTDETIDYCHHRESHQPNHDLNKVVTDSHRASFDPFDMDDSEEYLCD
ncbi:hypothetical protein BASA60_009439 [Batrachochytrium salamandrivorans]|nr:hypothetical protein BASA60_009439 [Batrachochytrium salamandrivorans]